MTDLEQPIRTDLVGDPPVLHIVGELDAAVGAALTDAIDRLAASSQGELMIDLSGVTFMDSSALSVLINARQHGPVVLCNVSEVVRRVVELTGLGAVLDLRP